MAMSRDMGDNMARMGPGAVRGGMGGGMPGFRLVHWFPISTLLLLLILLLVLLLLQACSPILGGPANCGGGCRGVGGTRCQKVPLTNEVKS